MSRPSNHGYPSSTPSYSHSPSHSQPQPPTSNNGGYPYQYDPAYTGNNTYVESSQSQQPTQPYQQYNPSLTGYQNPYNAQGGSSQSPYPQAQPTSHPQSRYYISAPQPPSQYLTSPQSGPIYQSPQQHALYQQSFSPQNSYSPIALPPAQPVPGRSTPVQQPVVGSYNAVDPSLIYQQPPQLPRPPPSAPLPSAVPYTQPIVAQPSLKIKLKAPPPQPTSSATEMTGRSTRHSHVSAAVHEVPMSSGRPSRGASQRAQAQLSLYRDDDGDDFEDDQEDADGEDDAMGELEDGDDYVDASPVKKEAKPEWGIPPIRPQRSHKVPERFGEVEEQVQRASPEARRGTRSRKIIDPDDSDDQEPEAAAPPPRNAFPPRSTRTSLASAHAQPAPAIAGPSYSNGHDRKSGRAKGAKRERHSSADGEDFEPTDEDSGSEGPSSDPLGNYEEDEADDLESVESSPKHRRTRAAVATRSAATRRSTRTRSAAKGHDDSDDEYGARRNLRTRTSRPNYQIPTMDEISKEISMAEAIAAVARPGGRPRGGGGGVRFGATGAAGAVLPWHMRGTNVPQAMGDPDTSDSDDFATPMKSGGGAAGPSMTNAAPAAVGRTGAGGPSDVPNFGRINPKSNTADADPLGVDMNVTFDNVGGLDDHINQLKEMVALPLLYPELFQQFGITPPRGVLFHGPPGTGKTLLARALAASCSTGNTKIAFFMRKGADVLSKWVGEAERQLRMLFEEARASQPSIIFFDEIDGLAPVRSSKQDQIHASLVSTLLALMDGMDGRGQVIVIGATNRPDAVDPALRRPGRFDREFYFPLPNRAARQKIIGINTRKWEPKLSDEFLDKLAVLTKGYGGADLRALCTEAALNAIQRRYPQIYKTADRLQLEAGSIHVQPKDFMMSIKKIVPSSARSTSSPAIQLPQHLVPLLSAPLERLKKAIDHVLPPKKHRTALEEAEYEDDHDDSFEKHMILQSLDKLRTFRPRILVHGEAGLGQTYLGPAVLHHLEGFHVQSFDLGTLMGDSTRSVEAAVVQLFVEAKRHQPSVIFVPSLSQWANTITDTARSTVRALLDGIPPSDPILLLGMADGPVDQLPPDVRAWFGFAPENKIELVVPDLTERVQYFSDLIASIRKPPTDFPDAIPRRKRVLEILPLAAPLPPRQPTAAELAREEERDQAARNMMIISFTGLVQEFKKFRKVVATVKEDAMNLEAFLSQQAALPAATADPAAATVMEGAVVPGPILNGSSLLDPLALTDDNDPTNPAAASDLGGPAPAAAAAGSSASPGSVPAATLTSTTAASTAAPALTAPTWRAHPIDIDTLNRKLIKHKYFTPADFLSDISKIEENAARLQDPEREGKVAEMAANARLHVSGFDPKWTPEFERYAERMRERKKERQRRKELEAETPSGDGEIGAAAGGAEVNGVNTAGEGGTASAPASITVVDPVEDGTTLKRAREDEDSSQGREKRAKSQAMDVDPPSETPSSPSPETKATSTNSTNVPTTSTVPPPRPASAALPPTQAPTSASAEPTPTPIPPHPPFVLPPTIESLTIDLRDLTAQLNVDQLEQLRASLFDQLWRARGEWDRTAVVEGMRKLTLDFTKGVREWKEAGGWEV